MSSSHKNRTFRGYGPTWANACVGENGSPQIIDYANGFSAAANILLDKVIEDEGIHHYVDELVYPIGFNIRHAVELRLKATAVSLKKLSSHRSKIPDFDLAGSHDIGLIWKYIKNNSESLDKRYKAVIIKLNRYIIDIADIDATGQVFRYPFSTENKKHLVDVAVINLLLLKYKFKNLEKILGELHDLNMELVDEYAFKSYTSKLSRADLFEVAKMLPPRNEWGETTFNDVKERIKAKFDISSNELSKALNIIQGHYELAQYIHATPRLPNTTLSLLELFLDCWVRLNDLDRIKNPKPIEINSDNFRTDGIEGMIRRSELKAECWKELEFRINPRFIAEITALYYFADDSKYTENFQRYFDSHVGEITWEFEKHPSMFKQTVLHMLTKTTGLENILYSLYRLGQSEFAENIYHRYELGECFPWLARMRKNSLPGQ
jgi:hypothetical protein